MLCLAPVERHHLLKAELDYGKTWKKKNFHGQDKIHYNSTLSIKLFLDFGFSLERKKNYNPPVLSKVKFKTKQKLHFL